ncbi:hypothetical protein MPTK1_6g19300 [Marchantia polymorpha subsp. ruderalis]|uniref:Uncharacterized protein n=2 Tax=Marchantia polymorpha TaxID=3197 RepID=A0AAF6BTR5_MARPO|nr:hypothetical protein MARPO_0045s0133 [Marchantia polymorpha]BBN15399.1 hypothetical protein Mp_6g19300 [Marchantia polymorpha subsp. ruderalis]|eukprot:PTQ39489.1 hypothetical protein MARPO_0045s0133 [Marchantia polymorpha]
MPGKRSWRALDMEEYFQQFLGSRVTNIDKPNDRWSSRFVLHLTKNGVNSALTVVGGSFRATTPRLEEVVPDESTNASVVLRGSNCEGEGILIQDLEVKNVNGFINEKIFYWSALVRITLSAGSKMYKIGDLKNDVAVGLWPFPLPFKTGHLSVHMQFMRDYLNLLEGLQVSAIEYQVPGQLIIRVLRSSGEMMSEELLVLYISESRICASIDVEDSYVDLPNLTNYLINACVTGELYFEGIKTANLQGSRGPCPGQQICLCNPLPQTWTASVEIVLKWRNCRIKMGELLHTRDVFICDIVGTGLWPTTVPFRAGFV